MLISDIFTSYCEKYTTTVEEFVPTLLTRNNTKVLTRSIGFTSMNDFFSDDGSVLHKISE